MQLPKELVKLFKPGSPAQIVVKTFTTRKTPIASPKLAEKVPVKNLPALIRNQINPLLLEKGYLIIAVKGKGKNWSWEALPAIKTSELLDE